MPNIKITKTAVDGLAASGKRYTAWDCELKGFGVRVAPTSRKTYIVQYRIGGRHAKSQMVKLGVHGSITPDQARRLAQQILGEVAGGTDVAAQRRAAKREVRTAPTVNVAASDFLNIHAAAKLKPRSSREYTRLFKTIICPALGARLVKELSYGDIEKLHHTLKATPAQANRTVAVLSKMMSWAIRAGYRPDRQNPCKGIERYREKKKQRFLSEKELGALGAALCKAETEGVPWDINSNGPNAKHLQKDAAGRLKTISPFAAAAIRLLIFTGARLNEILTLQWAHVDLDAGVLRLPDSKTGEKTIALNAPAIAILGGLDRIEGNSYVIPGDIEKQHRSDLKRPWSIVRTLARLYGVRIHDLRHTLASHGRAAGVTLSLVGGLLGHKNVATTQGYAHLWDDPLKEAANKVGKRIEDAMLGRSTPKRANVVALRRRKAQ